MSGPPAPAAAAQREWLLLQAQHEAYEWAALALKALAVVVFVWAPSGALAAAALPLLWLQEAIVKTWQARLAAHLLQLERQIAAAEDSSSSAAAGPAMQLHSRWQAGRPGGVALLRGYGLSALRPTVAFPHLPLLILLLFV